MNLVIDRYRYDIDLLKGCAIIAVVLYHAGWCKSGYLGVDVFFVVSGFLVIPSVMRQIREGNFRYLSFLEKRLFRLLPLVLLVSGLSLLVGYWGMLPGDYCFLSEEAVSASVFMNNILQAVTTQNYWAAIYHKVLMHTWYLGVLFQFYLVFPLLLLLLKRRMKAWLLILTLLSLLLYLLPIDTIGNKYYLLPYRFFEMGIGGLVGVSWQRKLDSMGGLSLFCLLLMIFFGTFTIGERAMPYNLVGGTNTIRESLLPRELLVLLTVLLTSLFLYVESEGSRLSSFARRSRVLAPLGRMSLSIFLWHQPVFAFYRYFFEDQLSLSVLLSFMAITLLLSCVTYRLIERRIRISMISRVCLLVSFLAVNAFALWVYRQGGVVRDVPELDILKGSGGTAALERYTNRIYQYDKEFELKDSVRTKVLIVGNSFARDFANILLESSDSSRIQLSYHYGFDDCPQSRVRQCDRLYFFGWKYDVPSAVWQSLCPESEIWGIGTKNFGTSNGIFYKNRYREDYFAQRASIPQDFHTVNHLLREQWGDRYVDLLTPVLQPDSTVPIFTPDRHFIVYDGKHLTPAGARYYVSRLNAHILP